MIAIKFNNCPAQDKLATGSMPYSKSHNDMLSVYIQRHPYSLVRHKSPLPEATRGAAAAEALRITSTPPVCHSSTRHRSGA
jgi:hypothetical protein